MRTPLALALVLAAAACGPGDRSGPAAAHDAFPSSSTAPRGPDLLVLRLPRSGGPVNVYAYPALDSIVWSSSDAAPAIDHVLAFDDDAGLLAYVDSRGLPGRIDFRAGEIARATRTKLADLGSADASAIYGVTKEGSVLRLTPSGDWTLKPPQPARAVIPLMDGALVVLAALRGDSTEAWRLFPPESRLLDTVKIASSARAPHTEAGDRLYFAEKRTLIGFRLRDLQRVKHISLDATPRALAATPSGDRIYVVPDSGDVVAVVDRYREEVSTTIDLPGTPAGLRMDPLGRYLLVRAADEDSAWVIAVATNTLLGALPSKWREDLPYVAADGAIAVADGADVVFYGGTTLQPRKRVAKGAGDFWYGFAWSGFRPRAASLDQPVTFPVDSVDSTQGVPPESTGVAPRDTTRPPAALPPAATTPPTRGWVVSFAALLSEERARLAASQIHVGSETARVVPTTRDGQTIYRVVLGPYPTREDADRVGRESRQNYWVYEGTP